MSYHVFQKETVKEYSNKLLSIANKIKLLGSDFAYSRIVEKILVTVCLRRVSGGINDIIRQPLGTW